MTGLTIGPNATPVTTPNGQNDLFGQNTGAVTVYLSELSDVSPANKSVAVTPGNNFTWPNGKQLYACTDPGTSGQISFVNNGATVGIATVNSKSSNAPVLLDTRVITAPDGAFGTSISGSGIDLSGFASIIFSFSVQQAQSPLPLNPLSFFELITNQRSATVSASTYTKDAQYLYDYSASNAHSSLQIPVKNSRLDWVLILNKQALVGSGGTLTMQILGTNDPISAAIYIHNSLDLFGNIPIGGFAALPSAAAGIANFLIASINGPAIVGFGRDNGGSTAFCTPLYYEQGNPNSVNGLSIASGGNFLSTQGPYFFPMRPVAIQLNQTAAGNMNGMVTQ